MKNKNWLPIILSCVIILLLGIILGNLIFTKDEIQMDFAVEYDTKYFDFDQKTTKEKMEIYDNLMQVGTSPTEIKYLLLKMKNELTEEQKEIAFSMYLNHLQYFATTYTNVAGMYDSIIESLSYEIDFSSRDAAYKVSDKVLRNLLLEIWDSDMFLHVVSNNSPRVMVNYDTLKEKYSDCMGETTLRYLELKEHAVTGGTTNEDGSMSYAKLEQFMDDTYDFIDNNMDYNLVDDVKFMYVTAAQMYLNVYNMFEEKEYTYTDEELEMYKKYIDSRELTPIRETVELILSDCAENNNQLKEGTLNTINSAFYTLQNS